uniref:Cyclin-like domain-containing protein n=1 Tax=Ditylenchus dipsaci TaxID=166011 RepID=A0A915EFG1_9BILA
MDSHSIAWIMQKHGFSRMFAILQCKRCFSFISFLKDVLHTFRTMNMSFCIHGTPISLLSCACGGEYFLVDQWVTTVMATNLNTTDLWCTEFLTESPSTSARRPLAAGEWSSGENCGSSGWMSAERRRFNGISLHGSANRTGVMAATTHSAPRHSSQLAQHPKQSHLVVGGQSRRSLGFGDRSATTNENMPQHQRQQHHQQMSASTNDISSYTNSSSSVASLNSFGRKSQGRVLSSIDTNANGMRRNSLNVSTLAVPPSPSVHAVQRSAARKRRLAVDQQLNVAQRLWVSADVDKAVHLDGRALASLLRAERYVLPSAEHFRALQTEINEHARRSAIVCINDICTRENCDLVVFPLAVSFIDRVLSVQFVPRHNLLALANACLLLASKMKAPRPLTAHQIVEHTDKWVPLEELLDWELLIVNKLGWQLSTATAFEFFDQLMVRAPILETLREQFANTLNVMLKDLKLATLAPSKQAASVLLYVADESNRRHLISESEETIRRCFHVDVNSIRSLYSTDIRFALGDWFFDDVFDNVSSPATISNGPKSKQGSSTVKSPASKRFVLAEQLCVEEMCAEEKFVIVGDEEDEANSHLLSSAPSLTSSFAPAHQLPHTESLEQLPQPSPNKKKKVEVVNADNRLAINCAAGSIDALPSNPSSSTHRGDDSGFVSTVSTPEMTTTTTVVSNAPAGTIIYCNARMEPIYQHQRFGQLF